MPEISSLTRPKPTRITLELGPDSVSVVFDANRVTPRWMDSTMKGANETDLLVLAKSLAAVLVSWDVTDDGAPYPPTTENLAGLSFPALNELLGLVCESAAPESAEGNASSPSANEHPSDLTPESGISLNGSDSSTSQTSSASPVLR